MRWQTEYHGFAGGIYTGYSRLDQGSIAAFWIPDPYGSEWIRDFGNDASRWLPSACLVIDVFPCAVRVACFLGTHKHVYRPSANHQTIAEIYSAFP